MAVPGRSVVDRLISRLPPGPSSGRVLLLDTMLTVCTILLVWIAIGSSLYAQYDFLLEDAEHATVSLSRVHAESVTRMISEIDHTILFLRNSYARDPAHFDIAEWERRTRAHDDLTVQISIIDRHGRLLMSDLDPSPAPIDLSDREHFRVFANQTGDELFISKPLMGRRSGQWTIQFARRIVDQDGSFGGVVVISVNPMGFADSYHALDVDHGTAQLIGLDGVVRAQAPDSAVGPGKDLTGSKLMLLAATQRQGTFWNNGAHDNRLVTSFRRVGNYPLIVSFSVNRADALAPLWGKLPALLAIGLFSTILIAGAGAIILRGRLSLIKSRNVLFLSQEILHTTLDNISQGIMMVDAKRNVPLMNRRVVDLLGLPERMLQTQPTFDDIINWQLSSGEFDGTDDASASLKKLVIAGGVKMPAIYERTRTNGQVLEIRTHPLSNGGVVRTYTDITERKKSEAHIAYLAHHDGLSGLPNRRLFNSRLADAVNTLKRGGDAFAVLCLDLDRFKPVNDTYGHAVGDRLLIQVADRLRGAVREGDVLARIGGDEFVILQRLANQPHAALVLADRLVMLLRQPYDIDGHKIMIGVSAGIALCPSHGTSPDQLQKHADKALYEAKAIGRNAYRLFNPEKDADPGEGQSLERDFRDALGTGQLQLRYQPIFTGSTGALTRFEALARWTHPIYGDVAPDDFIPLAERNGTIVELGRWALKTAAAEAARWPGNVRLAVNLSALAFNQAGLPDMVAEILAETGLPPERLDLELTETVFQEDKSRMLANMRALKAQGVHLALNDFGTKHANLGYLESFPFDSLKIAKSIIRPLGHVSSAAVIVEAALLLAHRLNLTVVAEGVEEPAQLEWLKLSGCDEVQGFLLGSPVTAAEVTEMLQIAAGAG
jgi:diguanylate cyclase (GGDEF)-like protein